MMNFRNTALAGSMIVVLGLAACGEDDQTAETATENEQVVVEETAPAPATDEMAATDEPALAEETATAEAPAVEEETVAVEDSAPPAADEQESAFGADGEAGPTLAELEGRWAESEEMCGTTEIAFAPEAITLPEGICEVQSSEGGDGTLSLEVACEGDAGQQSWMIETAQGDASADEITLERAAGERVDLVRCEG